MKITLAYLPAEEQEAVATAAAFQHLHPGAKIRKSDRNPPFKHLYLTIKSAGTNCGIKKNA